eukprot:gb/GECG01008647.1/.p1 GENE.gb/GECG01008647.1/~~gb/GECG01008647.1/.p1  ORF type:complete len:289 (+),score=25.30 gb/GECG01008647.1/:1-867(+)
MTGNLNGWREFIRQDRKDYASCYCEENIYQLCRQPVWEECRRRDEGFQGYVIFLSNADKKCAVWHQRAAAQLGPTPATQKNVDASRIEGVVNSIATESETTEATEVGDDVCVWDYHVILVTRHSNPHRSAKKLKLTLVWDLDSTLDFPTPLSKYVEHAFKYQYPIKERFRPHFRVVSMDQFLRVFGSDRSHMLDADGEYMESPPEHPCIQSDPRLFLKDHTVPPAEKENRISRHNLSVWTDTEHEYAVDGSPTGPAAIRTQAVHLEHSNSAFGICTDFNNLLGLFEEA